MGSFFLTLILYLLCIHPLFMILQLEFESLLSFEGYFYKLAYLTKMLTKEGQ